MVGDFKMNSDKVTVLNEQGTVVIGEPEWKARKVSHIDCKQQ